jgi:hypothetical protein
LTPFPLARRKDWVQWVDQPQTVAEQARLANCIKTGRPFGSEKWVNALKKQLGWPEPLPRGRPRRATEK